MLTRRAALNAFLRENERRAYDFGTWDCAVFAFGAVLVQTGADLLAPYRGRYFSYPEAESLMREIDRVPTVRALADVRIGNRIELAQARTGDVVAFGNVLGILYDGRGLFLAEKSGYERLPRSHLTRAWKVNP